MTSFVKGVVEDSNNKKFLSDILFKETGKQWHIKYKDAKATNQVSSNTNENPINSLGLDINVIE